jgi:molecular chaperone GrpE
MNDERDDSIGSDAAVTDAPADRPDPASKADASLELRREKDALQDRLLRTAAEFDNYRKRVERERRDQADAAKADAIEDLLPIIDNLERALQAPIGADAEGYRKGVELVHQQMMDLLRRRGYTLGDRLLRPAMVKVAKA